MTPSLQIMKNLITFTREHCLEHRTFTGAFIVKENNVIAKAMTTIETDQDRLAHAEMNVIKSASMKVGMDLNGCVLYTTQKPCPMCASAMVWSSIGGVVYGWNGLPGNGRPNRQWKGVDDLKKFLSQFNVECVGPFLEKDCKEIDDYLRINGI